MEGINFKERLRELRIEKEMKQSDLAKLLSIHFTTVSDWGRGKSEPDFKTLYKLSQIFQVPVGYVLGVED